MNISCLDELPAEMEHRYLTRSSKSKYYKIYEALRAGKVVKIEVDEESDLETIRAHVTQAARKVAKIKVASRVERELRCVFVWPITPTGAFLWPITPTGADK